ncbi:MAG: hypothetical protein KKG84_01070, partial [Candidatus Omnitrophica bacterium]|nr:hypothetical protein [Candidatus Omnitrophota bacterium]
IGNAPLDKLPSTSLGTGGAGRASNPRSLDRGIGELTETIKRKDAAAVRTKSVKSGKKTG